MKLPIKTRILQYAIQRDSAFTAKDVYNDLKDEYPGERFFNQKTVDDYVDSLIGVGFFDAAKLEFDENGELVIYCVVTEEGKSREKYMK